MNGVAWIGDLELRFDANRWDVNGAKTAYDLYCKTADCARTTIAVTVADATADACTPEALTFEDAGACATGRISTSSAMPA